MRIQMECINMRLPDELRQHAERCIWLALQRMGGRARWALLRFIEKPARVVCEIDAWLGGIGAIAVKQIGPDPYIAVDRAAARLRLTAMRRVEELTAQSRVEAVLCET